MKIAVLGCFYDCADLLPKVLAPWEALKAEGQHEVIFGAINAQFKEYAAMGYQNDDEATRQILNGKRNFIDILHITPELLLEKDVRNLLLRDLLAHKPDVVWLLDGDEVYTLENIKSIIDFIGRTPQFDYYHVNFDNRVFDTVSWLDNFYPPRVIRADRRGGIKEFTFDNQLTLSDGQDLYTSIPGIIPKRVAHVLHYTWRRRDISKKIAYQEKHFGLSGFMYDETTGRLSCNPVYFKHYGMPTPDISLEKGISFSTKPPVNVRLVQTSAKPDEREKALVWLTCALLAIERGNDFVLRLRVVSSCLDPKEKETTQKILDLCPFEVQLLDSTLAPDTEWLELTTLECLQDPHFIKAHILKRFPLPKRTLTSI